MKSSAALISWWKQDTTTVVKYFNVAETELDLFDVLWSNFEITLRIFFFHRNWAHSSSYFSQNLMLTYNKIILTIQRAFMSITEPRKLFTSELDTYISTYITTCNAGGLSCVDVSIQYQNFPLRSGLSSRSRGEGLLVVKVRLCHNRSHTHWS